jgi:hypothetical protein
MERGLDVAEAAGRFLVAEAYLEAVARVACGKRAGRDSNPRPSDP